MQSTAEAIGGTVQEATSGATGHLARFAFAPPRHFVLPAVLLLLSEEPSYGYEMVKGLRAFRFGDVDRPAVYRGARATREGRFGAVVVGGVEGRPGAPGLRPDRRRRARAAHVDGRRQGRTRCTRPGLASLSVERHARGAPRRSHRRVERVRRAHRHDQRERCRARGDFARAVGGTGRLRAAHGSARRRSAGGAAFLRLAGPFRGAHRSALDGRADHVRRDRHRRVDRDHRRRRRARAGRAHPRAPRDRARTPGVGQPALRRRAPAPDRRPPTSPASRWISTR